MIILWLIEHPNNGNQTPAYWGLEEGEESWTGDIEAAHKFAAHEFAEKWAGDVGIPDYRIVDHQWLDHTPTTKSVAGPACNCLMCIAEGENSPHYRRAQEVAVDCSCARAGFPGSCHNCDADSGPIKFWRDRALHAESALSKPVAWVIPGENARDNGFIDAMAWEEGEFTKPLYALPDNQ